MSTALIVSNLLLWVLVIALGLTVFALTRSRLASTSYVVSWASRTRGVQVAPPSLLRLKARTLDPSFKRILMYSVPSPCSTIEHSFE